MTDTELPANVTPLRSAPKDPTAALRARRARRKRKTAPRTVTVPLPAIPVEQAVKPSKIKPNVTVDRHATRDVTRHGADVMAYTAAIALAGAAAWFSVRGMVVLFPGAPLSVVAMAVAMEGAKLVTAGWLAARWQETAWFWRFVLVALVACLAVINGVGVFSQLVAAHVGGRGAAQAAVETQDAALAAKIEVAAGKVADLDRRLGQIDTRSRKRPSGARPTLPCQRSKASAGPVRVSWMSATRERVLWPP
jgi:hypothetical protein